MAKKKKFYTVWVGYSPGVYDSWDRVKKTVDGYNGAKYKSFLSRVAAEQAFQEGWEDYYQSNPSPGNKSRKKGKVNYEEFPIVKNSISVDAACSGNPGKMEYRGVDTMTAAQIFKSPVFPIGTNNIGEFLALVHALAMYHKTMPELSIYSDSKIAIGWVYKGKIKTNLVRNAITEPLFGLVDRAEKWLNRNQWENPILKWETRDWGEIPADFGRK